MSSVTHRNQEGPIEEYLPHPEIHAKLEITVNPVWPLNTTKRERWHFEGKVTRVEVVEEKEHSVDGPILVHTQETP